MVVNENCIVYVNGIDFYHMNDVIEAMIANKILNERAKRMKKLLRRVNLQKAYIQE